MSGNGRSSLLPGRVGMVSLLLGLLSVVSQTRHAQSTSSDNDIACPSESLLCLSDAGCASCITTLQAFAESSAVVSSDFEECSELYDSLCGFADGASCDMTNTVLLDFATCLAQEEYGCSDFVACNPDVLGATPTPTVTNVTTSAPTAGVTTTPSVAAAITTFAPTVIGTPNAGTSEPRDAEGTTSGAFRSSATHTITTLAMLLPVAITVMCFAV